MTVGPPAKTIESPLTPAVPMRQKIVDLQEFGYKYRKSFLFCTPRNSTELGP